MKSFLNTCNLFWSADFKGNTCVMIYHDINFYVYTFILTLYLYTYPMPEKKCPSCKSPSQLTFFFKPNATMNYHDSQ